MEEDESVGKIKKNSYQPWEIAYIQANYETKTDEEIGKVINRPAQSILMKRQRLGLTKNIPAKVDSNGKIEEPISKETAVLKEINKNEYSKLSKKDKRKLFEIKFKNTKRYEKAEKLLTDEEMDFYIERWMDYVTTWETLLITEEDTLHLAIMDLIRANRILEKQKKIANSEDDDNPAPIDLYDKQYKECVESYSKLMGQLAGTRQQRLASNKEDKMTLVSVVQHLQDIENRKKAGQEATAIEVAKKAVSKQLKDNGFILE